MRQADTTVDEGILRFLRLITLLWTALFLAQMGLDALALRLGSAGSPLPPGYYLLHGGVAVGALLLAWGPAPRARLGRAFLPLFITGISVFPLLGTAFVAPGVTTGPLAGDVGLLGMRQAPLLCIAVVLAAWQYPWQVIVLLSGLIGITIAPLVGEDGTLARAGISLSVFLSFLTLGYAIHLVVLRLRTQSVALVSSNEQLRHYASTLESLTTSRERNRLARELHDTLAHTLSGVVVQLETTKAYWEVDPAAAYEMLGTGLEAARSGLMETRRALRALRASPLDDLGLRLALVEMARSSAEGAGLSLELTIPEPLPALSPDVEQCIYRVAQEAISNATQHARASHLSVHLGYEAGRLTLVVRDDGCGFDARHAQQPGHYGLLGMRERATLAGGRLGLSTLPGGGTTVRLSF